MRILAALTYKRIAGYFGGGETVISPQTFTSGIDKITFLGDTKTTLSATLTTARGYLAGMANSGTAGYFAGGSDSGGRISGIDKITFPGDTKTTLSAVLTTTRSSLAGMANSGVAGYFGGGSGAGRLPLRYR